MAPRANRAGAISRFFEWKFGVNRGLEQLAT